MRFLEVGIIPLIHKALDFRSLRQNILASNIANVETPQYQAKDIYFLNVLEEMVSPKKYLELEKTTPKHLGRRVEFAKPFVYFVQGSYGNDENTVDIDLEMSKLSQNTITYDILSRVLSGKFDKLKYVIAEGRA